MLWKLLKMGVAAALIAYLFKAGYLDVSLFGPLLTPAPLALGAILTLINLALMAYRWFIILRGRGFAIGYFETFRLFMIGIFFNYALPGSIGGDVVKGYYLTQDFPTRKLEAAMSVLVDRILGLYSMVLLALVGLALTGERVLQQKMMTSVALLTVGLFIFMTAFLGLAFSHRVGRIIAFEGILRRLPSGEKLVRALESVRSFGKSRKAVFQSIVLSAVAQLISIAFMALVGLALNETIPLSTYLFAVPLGFIFASVPVAPAGLGVGQVAFLMLFELHLERKCMVGQTAITAFQLMTLILSLSGVLFYMQRKPIEREVLS